MHPCEEVVEFESCENPITSPIPVPDSLSTDLALSRPQLRSLDSTMINPILLNISHPPQTTLRQSTLTSESVSIPQQSAMAYVPLIFGCQCLANYFNS